MCLQHRLQTLRAVCATWTGAVTATIYLRVINDTIVYESTTYRLKDDAVKAVEDLHNVLKGGQDGIVYM